MLKDPKTYKIRNLALIVCIIAKNLEAMEILLDHSNSIYDDLNDDIAAAVLFCMQKKWKAGLQTLLP